MFLLHRFLLPLTLALLLIAGCSGKKAGNSASITGKLSYKDEPIKAGIMQFHTEQGVYNATINKDGAYTAVQLPIGKATVTIETESINPKRKSMTYGRGNNQMKMSKAETEPEALEYTQIPPKYAQVSTSGLTVELKPGKNKQDFPLTD